MRTAGVRPAPDTPADQATVRRLNLGLLMRSLLAGGPRSRARLAQDTGLTKATVSALVTELAARRMVTEGAVDRGGVGRPGRMVEVDTSVVRCVGLEVNVDHAQGVVADLTGRILARRRLAIPLADLGPALGIARAAELAGALIRDAGCDPEQIETLFLSVPGMIDQDAGILSYAPNLHWRQVDMAHALMGRLRWPRARVAVDNDANLGAMAEYAIGASAGSNNLLYLVGEIGVGAGVMLDGTIVRGRMGYAGEVGHIPIGPPDTVCGCGRRGCWETVVGLAALVRNAMPGGVTAGEALPRLDMAQQLGAIRERAGRGDPVVLAALADVGRWIGIGASVLANVLDPEVIILGGYFAELQEWLRPAVTAEMAARVVAEPQACRLEFSLLGFEAPAIGAAHAGIDLLVGDPSLVAVA
ncbi:ROK family protein [Nakamurella endophytica]|uniref:Transcriptional regulator n=1 Tax=Nakamurella endophytica TaxID=1748367 RepID=A0A917ST55_9ACTN|nr:ROK family protein [Nakamurella endophytica]GGL96523.1 transcriptional regulator [Nakamurella endophytica]